MLIADRITLFAIIVALAIGVRSIRESRKLQQKTLIHMSLNEVIGWAKSVSALAEERLRS